MRKFIVLYGLLIINTIAFAQQNLDDASQRYQKEFEFEDFYYLVDSSNKINRQEEISKTPQKNSTFNNASKNQNISDSIAQLFKYLNNGEYNLLVEKLNEITFSNSCLESEIRIIKWLALSYLNKDNLEVINEINLLVSCLESEKSEILPFVKLHLALLAKEEGRYFEYFIYAHDAKEMALQLSMHEFLSELLINEIFFLINNGLKQSAYSVFYNWEQFLTLPENNESKDLVQAAFNNQLNEYLVHSYFKIRSKRDANNLKALFINNDYEVSVFLINSNQKAILEKSLDISATKSNSITNSQECRQQLLNLKFNENSQISQLDRIERCAINLNLKPILMDVYYFKAKKAKAKNNNIDYVANQKKYIELKSFLNPLSSFNNAQKYINVVKAKENEKLAQSYEQQAELDKEKFKRQLYISIALGLLLLSLIIILSLSVQRFLQTNRTNKKLLDYNALIKKQNNELLKANGLLELANKDVKEALNAKSRFLAVASHEIRTPLNGVIGMSSILKNKLVEPIDRKYANVINQSSERLLSLLNDILIYSKSEAGKLQIYEQPVHIKTLINDVLALFEIDAEEKGIDLKQSNSIDVPGFYGDAMRIRQILINFMSNAIKFTSKGKVELGVTSYFRPSKDNKRLFSFYVKDTGIGISKEKQEVIFKSFEQENSNTDRQYGGIGLGLSINKHLAKLMNGDIKLESEKGQGTTFYLNIEAKVFEGDFENRIIEGNETDNNSDIIENMTILVAEDNEINFMLIEKILNDKNVKKLLHAENGNIAVELAKKHKPYLIFMDIQMPEKDGYEAMKDILDLKLYPKPFVVALTADDDLSAKEKFLSLGFDDFISKPFKSKEIDDVLTLAIGEKASQLI